MRVEVTDWDAARARARHIRAAVFIVEQKVPRDLEWDEMDALSRHALAFAPDGTALGTGRLLPDGHIGRMAVLREWRGRGVGAALLEALLKQALRLGYRKLRLHSQIQAAGFYARYGFVAQGPEYEEAGIPHVTMELGLG